MSDDISSMSIAELKRELLSMNNSSFVFNSRDELECALKAARRVDVSKKAAGFNEDETSGSSKGKMAPFEKQPDLAVSSTSSVSSNGDNSAHTPPPHKSSLPPPGAGSNVSPVAEDSNRDFETSTNAIADFNQSETSMWGTEEDDADSDCSRRLVEYFVMVSSIPVEMEEDASKTNKSSFLKGKQKAAAKSRKVHKSRPPDPSRDKMNSRTAGRFEVRRAHLSRYEEPEEEDEKSVSSTASTDDEGEDDGKLLVEDYVLEPVITARYPARDHPDQPLNIRLPQFCHPEGTDFIHPLKTYKMPRIHFFCLTDSLGGKQYGTALTVYEEFNPYSDCSPEVQKKKSKGKTYYAPRVLCLLSTWPYLTAFRTYLTQLYRLATTTDVMTAPIERYVQNMCSEIPAPPPGAFEVKMSILNNQIRFWAPPADQPIPYVSLPFKVLFECLDIGNVLFAWYTLACERKVLLVSGQLSLLTVCAEILCSLLFPMRWSHLYIPVLPRSLAPMLDAPMPYLCGISRENFPYAVGDISDETIVVDLDRNIITLGPNTPDLPPLPHKRRMKLEGALKANAGDVFWEARNLSKQDVLSVRASGDEKALSTLLGNAGAVWDEKINTRDDAFGLAHLPDSMSLHFNDDANVDAGDGKQSRWDAVQEAFLRFYVSMLQDYRKFLPADEAPNARTSWRGAEGISEARFKTEEFVLAQSPDFHPFLEELTMTQQFDDFVTKRMYNAGNAPDVTFFDQSIDAKKNRSKLKFKKVETPFLHSASAHKDLKSVDALEPTSEGLPPLPDGKTCYQYKMWPLKFDEERFGKPREIPKIISAEFDRRATLRNMLRGQRGIIDDNRGSGGRNKSPEVTAFILFFTTFTSVIGKEMSSVEKKHGSGMETGFPAGLMDPWSSEHSTESNTRQMLANLDDDMEVARTIARAQVDLAFHTLSLMRVRKLPPEPVPYKLLIEACGRTRVTHRANQLMEMITHDGLAANSEIYTSFIAAFAQGHEEVSALALYTMNGDLASDLSSSYNGSSLPLVDRSSRSESSLDVISDISATESTSTKKSDRTEKMKSMTSKFSVNKKMFKKVRPKSRKSSSSVQLTKRDSVKVTPAITKQIELGESLLDSLYPGLVIDTDSDACSKCATVLKEDQIIMGWAPCQSKNYQTKCPLCKHEFVPKFSVSCKSPSFEGSQGKGSTLYCDYLSPWVLLREMRSIIGSPGGVSTILDEKFRSGSDINATLWWNMVVTFNRYKLPYIFLLQGSFQNQLILPSPSLNGNDV